MLQKQLLGYRNENVRVSWIESRKKSAMNDGEEARYIYSGPQLLPALVYVLFTSTVI